MAEQNANNGTLREEERRAFGQFVKKHRLRKGYTQQQLAEILGITTKSISFIESGLTYPNQKNIFALARVLEMSLDEYVFGYSLSEKTIGIAELNRLLQALSPKEQEQLVCMMDATCKVFFGKSV